MKRPTDRHILSMSSTMDRFDRLVLRAAAEKRNEIINRYGDDGCSKLLEARKGRRESPPQTAKPELSSDDSHYKNTVQDLKKAQKELDSSFHSIESQKKSIHRRRQKTNNVEDDLDIDEVFELAWGSDVSNRTSTRTTNYRSCGSSHRTSSPRTSNPHYGRSTTQREGQKDDAEFARMVREGTVRKLLKARDQTAPKTRHTVSKLKGVHPATLAFRQWNNAAKENSSRSINEQGSSSSCLRSTSRSSNNFGRPSFEHSSSNRSIDAVANSSWRSNPRSYDKSYSSRSLDEQGSRSSSRWKHHSCSPKATASKKGKIRNWRWNLA